MCIFKDEQSPQNEKRKVKKRTPYTSEIGQIPSQKGNFSGGGARSWQVDLICHHGNQIQSHVQYVFSWLLFPSLSPPSTSTSPSPSFLPSNSPSARPSPQDYPATGLPLLLFSVSSFFCVLYLVILLILSWVFFLFSILDQSTALSYAPLHSR